MHSIRGRDLLDLHSASILSELSALLICAYALIINKPHLPHQSFSVQDIKCDQNKLRNVIHQKRMCQKECNYDTSCTLIFLHLETTPSTELQVIKKNSYQMTLQLAILLPAKQPSHLHFCALITCN